ncbi:MAG: DUF5399 family protein [Verrucomicrobia bacterium]|nr:DUF5399 family protein [Verrucomicrobiota bacterium]MBS0646641.1 DUF5399 family protein [Verrucomicrobiota bacterium]
MAEIFNDDINFRTGRQHAQTQQELEQFRQQHYSGGISSTIEQGVASSTSVLVVAPTSNYLDRITGVLDRTNWSVFEVPENFNTQRPSSIYLAPSLGAPQNQDADIKNVLSMMQQVNAQQANNPNAQLEGQPIVDMLTELKETNLFIDEVRARMNQFIQA